MTKKTETFRPIFDVEEVIDIVGYGKKSIFYNEAILKEIDYRKNISTKKYYDLKSEVKDKKREITNRQEEIEAIENILDKYEKELKRLKRKQNKAQNKLIEMEKDLEKLKTVKKAVNKDKKLYKQLLEENKGIIEEFVKVVIEFYFKDNNTLPKKIIFKKFNDKEELIETFGTFKNFINSYFYEYLENEVLTNEYYEYRFNSKIETLKFNPKHKQSLIDVIKNKNILDNLY